MNFQQLRAFSEAVRQGFNLTSVADALHTSQPGVSRQIKELEDELGVELFVRSGRRLLGLTEVGKVGLPTVTRILQEAENFKKIGAEFLNAEEGTLIIGATHTQARYALPPAVKDFCAAHPGVSLHLVQGSPRQIADQLISGEVDIGVATEALADYPELLTLPCYRWTHKVVVERNHELASKISEGDPLRLEQLSRYPLISYEKGFTGRRHIDEAFSTAGLEARFVLQAMDADVIKTYVRMGIGVGIIASVAFDESTDSDLVAIEAKHLFALNTTRVAIKRGTYLRGFAYDFIETFAPTLTAAAINLELAGKSQPG